MQGTSLKEEKKALRKRLRALLRSLPVEEKQASDALIREQVRSFQPFLDADCVFLYLGIDWEIRTEGIIEDALALGKKVLLPKVTGDGTMEARRITSLKELVPGAFDIPEPGPDTELCDAKDIDLALVPCVSCDETCMRLGQGGGFYDRFLCERSFPCAALCRKAGMVDRIPSEPFDMPVDYVITEHAVFKA